MGLCPKRKFVKDDHSLRKEMNFVTASRLALKRPKWVVANFMETTQVATENVLKGYERARKAKKEKEKSLSTELAQSTRKEHSYTKVNSSDKAQREVFGATILPSNLSFENMKKLSTNQIKLEEIPMVDETGDFEGGGAKSEECKKSRAQNSVAKGGNEGVRGKELAHPEGGNVKYYLDPRVVEHFDDIPGPRILENFSSALKYVTRHVTVFFILRSLRNGSMGYLEKYGPIVRLPELMGGRILLVNRAEHISAIYEQDKRNLPSCSLEALEWSRIRRHGKRKEVSEIDYDEGRKSIDKILLKNEEKYFDGLEESGNCLVRRIRSLRNEENEVPGDFIFDINHWSLECLLHILLDKSFGFLDLDTMKWPSKNAQLHMALREATRSLNICENGLQLWRHMKTAASVNLDSSCRTIEGILSHYIYETRTDLTESLSLAERMLLLEGMTKTDVVTNLLDTLIIGMNSTTNTLAYLLYHLARNPSIQSELFAEVKRALPEKYNRLEYDQVKSLKYLKACLKESLRLNMPMPVLTKYLNRDVIISNFYVPRGTFVLMPAQLEALKEENFEGAREFRPGRWLDPENRNNLEFLPLSAHSRNCFESRQAEISVMACVAQIVRNYIIEFNYGTLAATNSTISFPITPLTFAFAERED